MEDDYEGQIEPWQEESNKIPPHLLRRRLKTADSHKTIDRMTRLNRTQQAIIKKQKMLESYTLLRKSEGESDEAQFKFKKHNEAKIVTLDLRIRDEINYSNLRQVLLASKRQELDTITQKKSIKRFSKSVARKKTFALLDLLPGNLCNSRPSSHRKTEKRFHSTAQFTPSDKVQGSQKNKSFSLNITKMDLKVFPMKESPDFFKQVFNVWKEKNILIERDVSKSLGSEMKVQRQLFMKRNKKFKKWQNLKQRLSPTQGCRTLPG